MNKNLLIRTAVAAVAIPIILWICYQGGLWLWGMVTLFALVAMAEFLIAEGYGLTRIGFWLIMTATALNFVNMGKGIVGGHLYWSILYGASAIDFYFHPLTFLFLIGGMIFAVGRRSPAELFISHARLTWGIIYVFFLYQYVFSVGTANPIFIGAPGQVERGDILLFLFGLLWLGDTAAMFVGKAFGKHKLAPTVSPNKTVEGFVGGIVGAIVVAVILGFWRLDLIPMWQLVIIAILCSVFGQLGDLVESMWKRSLGIKDSSAIIPGHGGVLDRFDSLLFAAPVMYHALRLIGQ